MLKRIARAAEVVAPLVLVWWGVSLYDVRAPPVVVGAILWHRYLMDVPPRKGKHGILD